MKQQLDKIKEVYSTKKAVADNVKTISHIKKTGNTKEAKSTKKNKNYERICTLIFFLFLVGLLSFVPIWITIEKNEILYQARTLQNELDKKLELKAKLEVERGRLLSSQELEKRAQEIGMGIAESGQIRRLDSL